MVFVGVFFANKTSLKYTEYQPFVTNTEKKYDNKTSETEHNEANTHLAAWDSRAIHKRQLGEENFFKMILLHTLFSKYLLFCKATQAHRNQQSPKIPCFTCTSCRLFENNRGEEQMS